MTNKRKVERFKSSQSPRFVDISRIMVRYGEDGGKDYDGLIQIRRGLKDISIGNEKYAQVRIAINHDRYGRGMAVYADDKEFPEGVDIIYNTYRSKDTPKLEVFRKYKPGQVRLKKPFTVMVYRFWTKWDCNRNMLNELHRRADELDIRAERLKHNLRNS